jgi:hypothetical protein
MPDLHVLAGAAPVPTLGEATDAWRASRIDVPEHTRGMHTSSIGRIWKVRPKLRSARVDQISAADVADLVAAMHEAKYKRETIRKTRTCLAQRSTSPVLIRTRPVTSG